MVGWRCLLCPTTFMEEASAKSHVLSVHGLFFYQSVKKYFEKIITAVPAAEEPLSAGAAEAATDASAAADPRKAGRKRRKLKWQVNNMY